MLRLYVAPISDCEMSRELIPKERQLEVCKIENENVKREKYLVWLLLERALEESLGISIADASLSKDENGKWVSPHFFLSLTHGGGAVAVALSDAPVGVDAEREVAPRSHSFAERIMTDGELRAYLSLGERERTAFLTECWTVKESIFKMRGEKCFIPSECDTEKVKSASLSLDLSGGKCVISVASDRCDELAVHVLDKI